MEGSFSLMNYSSGSMRKQSALQAALAKAGSSKRQPSSQTRRKAAPEEYIVPNISVGGGYGSLQSPEPMSERSIISSHESSANGLLSTTNMDTMMRANHEDSQREVERQRSEIFDLKLAAETRGHAHTQQVMELKRRLKDTQEELDAMTLRNRAKSIELEELQHWKRKQSGSVVPLPVHQQLQEEFEALQEKNQDWQRMLDEAQFKSQGASTANATLALSERLSELEKENVHLKSRLAQAQLMSITGGGRNGGGGENFMGNSGNGMSGGMGGGGMGGGGMGGGGMGGGGMGGAEQISKYERMLDQKQDELNAKHKELEAFQTSFNSMNSASCSNLEAENSALIAKITSLERRLNEFGQGMTPDRMQTAMDRISQQKRSLEEEVTQLKQQLNNAGASNDTLRDERHKMRMRIQQLDTMNLELIERNGSLSKDQKKEEEWLRDALERLRDEKEHLKKSLEKVRDEAHAVELSQQQGFTERERRYTSKIQELEEQVRFLERDHTDMQMRMEEERRGLENSHLERFQRLEKTHAEQGAQMYDDMLAAKNAHSEFVDAKDIEIKEVKRNAQNRIEAVEKEMATTVSVYAKTKMKVSELQRDLDLVNEDIKDLKAAKVQDVETHKKEVELHQSQIDQVSTEKEIEAEAHHRKIMSMTAELNDVTTEKRNFEELNHENLKDKMTRAKHLNEAQIFANEQALEVQKLNLQLQEFQSSLELSQNNFKTTVANKNEELERRQRAHIQTSQELSDMSAEKAKIILVYEERILTAERSMQDYIHRVSEKDRELEFLRLQMSSKHMTEGSASTELLKNYAITNAQLLEAKAAAPKAPTTLVMNHEREAFDMESDAKAILEKALYNARDRAQELRPR